MENALDPYDLSPDVSSSRMRVAISSLIADIQEDTLLPAPAIQRILSDARTSGFQELSCLYDTENKLSIEQELQYRRDLLSFHEELKALYLQAKRDAIESKVSSDLEEERVILKSQLAESRTGRQLFLAWIGAAVLAAAVLVLISLPHANGVLADTFGSNQVAEFVHFHFVVSCDPDLGPPCKWDVTTTIQSSTKTQITDLATWQVREHPQ